MPASKKLKYPYAYHMCVCSFYPWTSSTLSTSARADSSVLKRYKIYCHRTTPQRYCNVTYELSTAVDKTMQGYVILLDMTGTAYILYEREKTKENIDKRNQRKQRKQIGREK
ncbi:MAG: hypothetical protein ABJF11_19915 [Reichenbachiella sp.]|uniref:hypothetical protein n=1 Tax=Reichenbachiella sp. TaxID=2184521 RepID=UPI003265DBBA